MRWPRALTFLQVTRQLRGGWEGGWRGAGARAHQRPSHLAQACPGSVWSLTFSVGSKCLQLLWRSKPTWMNLSKTLARPFQSCPWAFSANLLFLTCEVLAVLARDQPPPALSPTRWHLGGFSHHTFSKQHWDQRCAPVAWTLEEGAASRLPFCG